MLTSSCFRVARLLNEPFTANMPIEATTVLSTLSGVVTATFKIAEKVYEIRAVGEQSKGLVETINQVNQQLDTARCLRRQKSHLFSTFEKDGFEQTFLSTEKALGHVGKLVENARVDQQVYGPGSVRFQNKVLFVLRDSPHIVRSSNRYCYRLRTHSLTNMPSDGEPSAIGDRKSTA